MATLKVIIPKNSKQNIEGVVRINAPVEKVFQAHVDQDLFMKWFMAGKGGFVKKFDPTSGGSWRLGGTSEDGNEYEFCGTFHEVEKDERIIWTFEFLGMPERGHVIIERYDFVKIDDSVTEIHTLTTFMTEADRTGMIESGMEDGWHESIKALGELLEK